ncbi:MAG: RluA family pseudouridine synthase [Bacteroidetes bacterium]|nr:RluA family pseudouridine synthase [Bacteroidota bacterium]
MNISATKVTSLIGLLTEEFKGSSKSSVKKIILHGTVSVNGKIITNPSIIINPRDVVTYSKFKPGKTRPAPPLKVLYEDDYLLFVEKPAGILTYGEKGSEGTSVYKKLLEYFQEISNGHDRVYVVHRLDREVSGILLFAKSVEVQEKIKEGWKENEKKYFALVEGKPAEKEGIIKSWLKENSAFKMYTTYESSDAKLAITRYREVKEIPGHTLLEITLETGRKNQIRVQLAEIGCPITGDRKYGSIDPFKRQIRLHAFHFTFNHPVTGERMIIESKLPPGFFTLKAKDERYKT